MKISNRSQLPKRGYAALLTTLSLSLTIMAFAFAAFRETKQAHRIQSANQVKLDYNQKERAFLRALLHVLPNSVMSGMMPGALDNANDYAWPEIFDQALAQAQTDLALDPAQMNELGISVTVQSANTGNATYTASGMISAPNGTNNFVLDDLTGSRPAELNLPPRMRVRGSYARERTHPTISLEKHLLATGDPLYTEMDYPEISFGYQEQGTTFIAKRNWWAFTVNFGAESAAITGMAPTPRTYLLSVYEVPSQLAVSSSGSTTSLGKFNSGTDWDPTKISITGSIYATKARIENLDSVGNVASRNGFELGSSAPSTQVIGGNQERREQMALTNTFYPYSSSSDSGMVSFTPINRGTDFFDFFAGQTAQGLPNASDPRNIDAADNSVSRIIAQTGWDNYSIGATQTAMRVEVGQVAATSNQLPTRIFIQAKDGNGSNDVRQRATRGMSWAFPLQSPTTPADNWSSTPEGDDWFVQTEVLPGYSRPFITLYLDKLPPFLTSVGMDDVSINNSLWIGPNYTATDGIAPRKAEFPSLPTDTALLIRSSEDLSAYTNGLSIITPYRVYFADNFNNVPATPPSGSGITGDWYPPVSIYAPEKRFGTQDTNGKIELSGQVGYMPNDDASGVLNPLDLKDGGTDMVDPDSIQATLTGIQRIEDLPPINAMNWLTIIEEIR